MDQLRATYRAKRLALISSVILAFIAAWLIRHVAYLLDPAHISEAQLAVIWFISFMALAWSNVIAMFERPMKASTKQLAELAKLNVTVLVPAYNEDPIFLRECIKSLCNQVRRPQCIYIVDDGSTEANYAPVLQWIRQQTSGVKIEWMRTPNQGKRHAQGYAIKHTPDADIYLTVDSDTILDPYAIYEGLKPFANPRTASVAGALLPSNNDKNLLTRFSGLWEVVWQMIDRSGQSALGCVTVNSGPIAFYKAPIIRKYLDAYLNEEFMGRPVTFSDDSLLTTYSLMHGRTVQQPTAIAFSATPENVSHHLRRYVRWMRGSFIRTWWRFKYLPMNSYVYWLHLFKWFQMAMSVAIFGMLLASGSFTNADTLPYLIAVPVVLAYIQSLRYFSFVRNDQSGRSRLLNYALAPVATLWLITVLRIVRWYGYATCMKTGWGTRKQVEVTL